MSQPSGASPAVPALMAWPDPAGSVSLHLASKLPAPIEPALT